jgi:hypothetical protein
MKLPSIYHKLYYTDSDRVTLKRAETRHTHTHICPQLDNQIVYRHSTEPGPVDSFHPLFPQPTLENKMW